MCARYQDAMFCRVQRFSFALQSTCLLLPGDQLLFKILPEMISRRDREPYFTFFVSARHQQASTRATFATTTRARRNSHSTCNKHLSTRLCDCCKKTGTASPFSTSHVSVIQLDISALCRARVHKHLTVMMSSCISSRR